MMRKRYPGIQDGDCSFLHSGACGAAPRISYQEYFLDRVQEVLVKTTSMKTQEEGAIISSSECNYRDENVDSSKLDSKQCSGVLKNSMLNSTICLMFNSHCRGQWILQSIS